MQDDSTYTITVEAIDSAGNGAREDLLVGVDTLAPTITITNPRPGTSMLDQFADNVDVRGKTEGNARVFLYLARTPYGLLNDSFDVSGFPEEIQALTESQMQADCNIQIASSTLCGTHADYEVRADSAGNFEFDGIDFSTTAAGVLRLQQVGFDELNRFTEEEEGRRAQLLFIASDAAGRKGAAKAEYRITTCWSGNYTYDVQQLIEFQSPTMLSTERLAEGTESIYFYLQLSAAGVESEYEVSSVTLTPACDRVMMEDPRFEFSCRIMRQSCAGVPNEDRTTWYFSCPLSRFDNLAEFTDAGEWEDWFDAIKGEMIFPYKVRLGYEVTSPDGSKAREYQTSCESIAYPVDKARIDFSTLLPDWLLYDGVDVLDRSVDGLSTALDQVELVLEWVGIGCVSTFAIKFIATFVRKYRCSMEGWKDTIKDKLGNSDATKDKACPATEEAQNKLTNEQLKTQCEDCAKAWEWEESLYKTYRYLCDRVFCHTAPTAQTQTLSEAQILAMVDNEIAYTCSEAGYDVRGQPLRRVQCTKLRDKYTVLNEKTIPYDEECVEVAVRKSDGSIQSYVQRLAKNQPLVTDGIVKFELYEERPGTGVYAVKESDTRFITNAANTCAEVCEDAGYGAVTESAQCLTVQQCANIKEKGERESANYGFTSDCPNIGANRDTAARDQMGKDINKRTECCCTKPAEQDKNAGKYYTAYDKVDSVELFTAVERQKVKEKDTNKILSLGGGINTLVSMAAGTLGALAGRSNLAMPFLMSGVASFVAGIYASFYLIEPARNGLSKVNMFRETISGIKEVLNKERILLLAMILAGSSFLFQFFVKMWAPYIKPLTGSQKDFSWIWIVLMGGAFLGNCMSYVIKKDHFTVLFVSKIFLAISLPLCVISPGLLPKVMCLGMMEIAQGASGPLFNTEISQHIESARRATIMSAIGMVSSMGSMLGLLSGIFADKFGVETTWLWGGGMALVFFLYLGTRYSKSKK